jgi:cytochrome c-type biogenesis protein CcmF
MMEIGKIAVFIGLAVSALSIVFYLLSLRGSRRALWMARAAYAVTALTVVFCFGRLMFLVATKQFQYKYVFDYVSADLHGKFLYSATWAGQEGSFLLWALWTAVIGGLVAWKAGRWESRVMPFYITVLTFLFGVLAWLSPYNLMLRGSEYPADFPWPPINGMGLNPSLQNYWMAIHPPTIFFGFASLAVPFSYAIAALLWRDYGGGPKDPAGTGWAPRVMPWVLLTVATLGIGLFMGGYWAYETLGWHGFWAWDPVENASLFPWLGALGLLHGLIVQKSRGGMGRTNLFLAIASWLLFVYGTFLTRSGVLASFSVHAFGMLDNPALKLLLFMIAFYGLGGLILLAIRWRGIPGRPISDKLLSRDTAMVAAVTIMIASAVVIAIGTSWPLISRWPALKYFPGHLYVAKGVAAQPVFYNKFGSFLLIPALLAMAIVPFLAWGKTNLEKFLWKVLLPWFLSIGAGFLIVWFVLREASSGFQPDTPRMLVVIIGTLGVFAAVTNIALAVKLLRVKTVTMGGWLAHVGIGMLFLGTVITNVYEKTENRMIFEDMGPVKTSFGYALEFAGWTHSDLEKRMHETSDPQEQARLASEIDADWWKFDHAMRIRVIPLRDSASVVHADDGDPHAGLGMTNPHARFRTPDELLDREHSFLANAPVFFHRQLMQDDSDGPRTMRWPYIHKELARDFYIAMADDPQRLWVSATLRPGETSSIGDGIRLTGYNVRYLKQYRQGQPGQAGTIFGADMELFAPDGRKIPIRPGIQLGGEQGLTPVNTQIPGINGEVIMKGGMNAATREVTVEFNLPEAPPLWYAQLAVTNKPMVNLVWGGVLLMGLGSLLAMTRRAMEARKGAVMQIAAASGIGDAPVEAAVIQPSAGGSGNGKSRANGSKARQKDARAKAAGKG